VAFDFSDKTILITGGTGSFGKACLEMLLVEHEPHAVRIFSRDELKQSELQARYHGDSRLRYFIGDVRDRNRLVRATRGCDVIIHAAALKQVPACEYNPFEAVQTNIIGAENIVGAAIDNDVPYTIQLSTDKAVNPVNLYGATKLVAEKIVTQGNAYAADSFARFANVRYGNVVGSRGSVIPIFLKQRAGSPWHRGYAQRGSAPSCTTSPSTTTRSTASLVMALPMPPAAQTQSDTTKQRCRSRCTQG
jgi:UDP-N-acetylglucosamine 4,6-dehydratase